MFQLVRLLVNSALRPKFFRTMATKSDYPYCNRDYFVWIDLEMTGLEVDVHKIVEVACILTNTELEVVHEGIHLVIHHPKSVFENECNKWSQVHHEMSGLMNDSINSKISIEEADALVSKYIKKHTEYECNSGKYYLAGNSVYMDKRFLEKYMPSVDKLLHYRIVDVSTLKTLCSSWYYSKFQALPAKKLEHRALSDIMESIEELKLYKEKFFIL